MFVTAQVPRIQSVYTKKGTYETVEDMDSSRRVFLFLLFLHIGPFGLLSFCLCKKRIQTSSNVAWIKNVRALTKSSTLEYPPSLLLPGKALGKQLDHE